MTSRLRGLLKGAVGPEANDSRYLLDVHRRDMPGQDTMASYQDSDEVDLCIVGAGAGGSVLAQRLARQGWRVVIIEAGPFWHPDDYAGYCPRFHPSDFETKTRDGVGADWPISYSDLKPHYEEVERELPVAGQDWPWGDPHRYPFSPHPIGGAAMVLWKGAIAQGIELRAGPVGIVNGTFGNRPHCIYRGFCLQGCKVNAKASPYVTHLPDALAHGVEIRASSVAVRVEINDADGRATGVTYVREGDGVEHHQRARAVAVAGYSIETPRLLLHSTSTRFPTGLGNKEDQVGRYVMVQGASQTAGRFGEELRMYKAPPPEVSSEQFYETAEARGFARGFSIQTVSPQPIGWAEHVLADGHWGRALREYMRDYNHWTTIGVLNELLPHPENRVILDQDTDPYGVPVARFDYSTSENDKANIAYSTDVIKGILHAAGAQDILTIHRYAHLVGGARMGTSPENSVVNSDHRVWAVPNLFVADGSVCPTQGSANPALTIMALASRLAERLGSRSTA